MKIVEPKQLKRCTVCQKPIMHYNKSLLCRKHHNLAWCNKRMENKEYRAKHNLNRRILYHRNQIIKLEYEKANWGKE